MFFNPSVNSLIPIFIELVTLTRLKIQFPRICDNKLPGTISLYVVILFHTNNIRISRPKKKNINLNALAAAANGCHNKNQFKGKTSPVRKSEKQIPRNQWRDENKKKNKKKEIRVPPVYRIANLQYRPKPKRYKNI